jgi:hypothetical protein
LSNVQNLWHYSTASSIVGELATAPTKLTTPFSFSLQPRREHQMSEEETTIDQPFAVLQPSSAHTSPCVLTQEVLSTEDKLILYTALQAIANELRSIEHAKQNRQTETNN